MSSSSTDSDPRALTQRPRYPGHARRQGPAQIQRGAREEGGAVSDIDPSVLEDWKRSWGGPTEARSGSRTPITTRSPSWGFSSTHTP